MPSSLSTAVFWAVSWKWARINVTQLRTWKQSLQTNRDFSCKQWAPTSANSRREKKKKKSLKGQYIGGTLEGSALTLGRNREWTLKPDLGYTTETVWFIWCFWAFLKMLDYGAKLGVMKSRRWGFHPATRFLMNRDWILKAAAPVSSNVKWVRGR